METISALHVKAQKTAVGSLLLLDSTTPFLSKMGLYYIVNSTNTAYHMLNVIVS